MAASGMPDDVLSITVAMLPGPKLGATVLPSAGHQLPSIFGMGAGDELLHARPAGLPSGLSADERGRSSAANHPAATGLQFARSFRAAARASAGRFRVS